jgi:hypothetical protein
MQTNPAKELSLAQFVASLTKIDAYPLPPRITLPCRRLVASKQSEDGTFHTSRTKIKQNKKQ